MHYRVEFEKAIQKEKEIGHTVFSDCTLEELANIFRHNKDFEDSQVSMPCMCSL